MCCVGLEKYKIFYLWGLVCEILAYICQGVYCSRFPWTDRDVEGDIWTELGRERGLYERPHGGMYKMIFKILKKILYSYFFYSSSKIHFKVAIGGVHEFTWLQFWQCLHQYL